MPGERVNAILPAMVGPGVAAAAMVARVSAVGTETVELSAARGRVLAERIVAERDSPAADVSAMDGYALCVADVRAAVATATDAELVWLDVAFEVRTGAMPGGLRGERGVARIFTGGVLPEGADTVLRREAVREEAGRIGVDRATVDGLSVGQFVRRRGENAAAGAVLVEPGCRIDAAVMATLAGQGREAVSVYRKVRVGLAISGDEVVGGGGVVDGAAVRDSNGPGLRALVESSAWCEWVGSVALPDDLASTTAALREMVGRCDVVLTTGGVSMGAYDWLPDGLLSLGAAVVYHHLAMRPGKPNLGAVTAGGVAVLGLPGNPVSALVGAVVLGGPVLRKRAGLTERGGLRVAVEGGEALSRPAQLWQYVPAAVTDTGGVRAIAHRGSGDVSAIGRSDGVFELPAGEEVLEQRLRSWWPWSLEG